MKHPIQPLAHDENGVLRFKENTIVRELLEFGQKNGFGLNEIAEKTFSREDWVQFAQLIGYSLSGFSELSYVSDDDYNTADRMSQDASTKEAEARIAELEETISELKKGLRMPISQLFGIHPDDLSVEK